MSLLHHEDLTGNIIGAAIEVHRTIGPGLLESVYETCLCHELSLRRLQCEQQVSLPVSYKSMQLDCGYRIDLIVEKAVIVELKAIEEVMSIHESQLMTYLRLSGIKVGLLINFNVPILKDGITRRVC